MCIAIPSPGQNNAGAGSRWWRYLSSSPARLLGLSAALQLAVSGLSSAIFPPADPSAILAPSFVALGTLLLGLSLTRIPQRLGALPLSYPQLVVLFVLITAGGLLAAASSWKLAGHGLVLAGWLIALRALRWKLKWAPARLSRPLMRMFWLLVALAAALVAMLPGLHPVTEIVSGIGMALVVAGTWSLRRSETK